jgi:hypothetical protein
LSSGNDKRAVANSYRGRPKNQTGFESSVRPRGPVGVEMARVEQHARRFFGGFSAAGDLARGGI